MQSKFLSLLFQRMYFHEPSGQCYELYKRGPCPQGHILSFNYGSLSPQCKCKDGYHLHADGKCYRLNTRGDFQKKNDDWKKKLSIFCRTLRFWVAKLPGNSVFHEIPRSSRCSMHLSAQDCHYGRRQVLPALHQGPLRIWGMAGLQIRRQCQMWE